MKVKLHKERSETERDLFHISEKERLGVNQDHTSNAILI
jgi:hypothetical protein